MPKTGRSAMNARGDLQLRFYSIAFGATMAVAPVCSALAGAPFISSGKIGPTVHIPQQLSPKVTLDIHGIAQVVTFFWQAPTGQSGPQTFYTDLFSGRYVFQGSPGNAQMFGPYTQAGTWTLTEVEVCSYKGCTTYSGSALTALFPSQDLLVVN